MSIKTILVISMIIVAVNADIVFLNDEAKKACPKYSCKSANAKAAESCVKGKGKLTESRAIDVSPCTKDEVCPVQSVIDTLVGDADVDVKCAAPGTPAPNEYFAYPGEACVADKKQCKQIAYYNDKDERIENKEGTCTNSVCVGSLEGKKCDTLDACDLKYFCSGIVKDEKGVVTTPGTCKVLLKKDAEKCTRTGDCEAGNLCLAVTVKETTTNKCVEFGTLEIGAEVKVADASDAGLRGWACKSGLVNPTTGKCSEYKYDTDAKNIVDGKVSCIPGETCKYNYLIKEEKTADTKQCQCAYDANGSGFCPYSSHDAVAVDRFNAINKIKIENYKRTGVHNEHRDATANTDVAKSATCLNVYADVRYVNNVDCFKPILGSEKCNAVGGSVNFVNISIVAILAVLAMFF
jgi:hypothetical protein